MFFQRPDGIVRGGPVRLDQYGGDGGSQHDRQRREINPDFDRSFVGEVFEPPVDDAVSYRYGDNETRQYDAHVNFVDHPEDLADSRAVGIFSAPIFRERMLVVRLYASNRLPYRLFIGRRDKR